MPSFDGITGPVLPRPRQGARREGGEEMKITINGEERTVTGGNLVDLLRSLGIDPARVAVELNLDIVPKAAYADTLLKDGDSLEIVHFVGGG